MMNSNLAFLFPGQGSQSVGMLAGYADSAVVGDTFAEASGALGYDMWMLVQDNPVGKLDLTEYTQPALLTASTALLRLWRELGGVEAGHAAGHSLGEYSALVAAGSLNFSDAVQLVAFRGEVMRQAVPDGVGRMAAIIGLDDETLRSLCEDASDGQEMVWAANYNCPGQVVVAGHAAAVERVMNMARPAGARRALPLAVSAPSHTPLMQPAADAMQKRLIGTDLKAPDRKVWSNALAAPVQGVQEIRDALVRQLVVPVCWSRIVQQMHAMGVACGVEMGPGKVLSGLARRIERCLAVGRTETPDDLDVSLEQAGGI